MTLWNFSFQFSTFFKLKQYQLVLVISMHVEKQCSSPLTLCTWEKGSWICKQRRSWWSSSSWAASSGFTLSRSLWILNMIQLHKTISSFFADVNFVVYVLVLTVKQKIFLSHEKVTRVRKDWGEPMHYFPSQSKVTLAEKRIRVYLLCLKLRNPGSTVFRKGHFLSDFDQNKEWNEN